MKYSTLIEDMISEGATPEMILVAVRAVERQETDALERRRSADRNRQERRRSRDITLGNVSHAPSRSHVRAEDKTSSEDIEPQEEGKKRPGRDAAEFRSELSDLDAAHLEAFVAHRKSKRAANTGHAARLFRRDADKCGLSITEAVDTVISRNWITLKPEWLADRRQQAPPGQQVPSVAQIFSVIKDQSRENQPRPPEDRSGFRAAIPDLRPVRAG